MKKIGLILLTLGALAGAYLTVLDEHTIQWQVFIPILALGFIGVMLLRIGSRNLSQAEHKIATDLTIIKQSIDNIVEKVTQLNVEKDTLYTYDVSHEIDRRLIDDLNAFVDARETITHVYGLQGYVDVMSHYAGGERYLNRVWSASADGYIDEVHAYLEKAQEQFALAQTKFQALKPKKERAHTP